jgi:hypothetical protein
LYEVFDERLLASMRAEARRFTMAVSLDEGAGIRRLLTAEFGFVDASLNRVYGFAGDFGDELVRVDYDADVPRSGLLTQVAFLSGHASSSTQTSPILRGRFVLERLLCHSVPEPPPNSASTEPPEADEPIVTTRDFFTWKTSMPECATCHLIVNPPGFAFENFDAIGSFRSEEKGAPVDASGTAVVPEAFSFEDAKDFLAQLAEFPDIRTCYAKNWLEFARGRAVAEQDRRTLATLAQGFESDAFGARDVVSAIVRSAAFTHLAPVEGEP